MKKALSKLKTKRIGGDKFILFVGDEGAILVYLEGGKVVKRMFAPNAEPQNAKSLLDLLHAHPTTPVYMLVDIIDQSYVRHDLPPVSSMSVNKLIRRRLERDFAPDDIKGALRLGRDSTGRKDWNYLLISLARTPQLAQWLDMAEGLPNRFKGIYLVPVEAQHFILSLAREVREEKDENLSDWQLLVSHNKVGGFRQVVLKRGQLIFTRLAQPIGETVPEVIAGNIEQEVLNTIEYLKRLSFQDQAGLNLYIIVSQEIKNAIDPTKFKVTSVDIFTPYEVANRLKIEHAALPGDHFGDVVLAAKFGLAGKPVLRLSNPALVRLNILHNARLALRAACIIAGGALLLYSASALYNAYGLNNKTQELQKDKAVAEQRLAGVREQAKTLPADIDQITDVVSIYELFSKEDHLPFDVLAQMRPALEEGVLIKSINWQGPVFMDPNAATTASPYPVTLLMDVEFNKYTDSVDTFIAASNRFFERIRAALPNYDLQYSKLPGTIAETEEMQVDFDKKNVTVNDDIFARGKSIVITLTLRGPIIALPGQATLPEGSTPP